MLKHKVKQAGCLRARVHSVHREPLLEPKRRVQLQGSSPIPYSLALTQLFCELNQVVNSAEIYSFFHWSVSCSVSKLNQLTARFNASVQGDGGKHRVRSGGSRLSSFEQKWDVVLPSPYCVTPLWGTLVTCGIQLSATLDTDIPKKRFSWWPAEECSHRHYDYEEDCWQVRMSTIARGWPSPPWMQLWALHLNKWLMPAVVPCFSAKLEESLYPTIDCCLVNTQSLW